MEKSWDGYITALSKQTIPSSNIDTTVFSSGFQEYKVLGKNLETQKKYDAMFKEWEGVEASNKAIPLYRTEFMPFN